MSLLGIFFYILNFGFALFILFLTLAFVTGAPFVRSTRIATDAMIRLARIKPGITVYDLGSGDATLLFRAAALGAIAVGLEINPYLVLWSRLKILLSPYRNNITVRWQNFWRADFRDADVIFVYLLPWRMETLEKLLMKHCKTGTRIVSNSFIFPSLKRLSEDADAHVYVFEV
ncbi:hypothetical protein HY032_02965 [Candidatus Gottesmanbacteria bacterium]|nr:hypothetical protein [Candidatus Gottesmanbacteria bacterium]